MLSCRRRTSGAPLLLLGLVALLSPAGCAHRDRVEALKGADHFHGECEHHLEKKRYLEAIENCQRVVSNFPGSALVADAQYSLAEAYFGMKDYVSAVFEYQRLVDSYPQSRWADRAQFQIGESYYRQMRRAELDQTETYQALSSFRRFLDDNPTSPLVPEAEKRIADCRDRLGRKAYLSAYLYHRQGFLESARISYEEVLKAFPDTRWHDWATAQLGGIARQQGKLDEARRQWQEVEARTADEDLRTELREWLAELEAQGG